MKDGEGLGMGSSIGNTEVGVKRYLSKIFATTATEGLEDDVEVGNLIGRIYVIVADTGHRQKFIQMRN